MSDVLNTPMDGNDADASTIKEYLIQLLLAVWRDKEGFSGKRPFGNSNWDFDLYAALIKAGLIEGSFDETGFYIEDVDTQAGDALIKDAIRSLGG